MLHQYGARTSFHLTIDEIIDKAEKELAVEEVVTIKTVIQTRIDPARSTFEAKVDMMRQESMQFSASRPDADVDCSLTPTEDDRKTRDSVSITFLWRGRQETVAEWTQHMLQHFQVWSLELLLKPNQTILLFCWIKSKRWVKAIKVIRNTLYSKFWILHKTDHLLITMLVSQLIFQKLCLSALQIHYSCRHLF